MKYDLQDSWAEDSTEGKVVVVNVAIRVADGDPTLARQMVKDVLERAGVNRSENKRDGILKDFFDKMPPLSQGYQKMARAGAHYIRGKLGKRMPLSDAALEELRTLMQGLPTEDGKDYINDIVIWAAEHGTTLLEELDASRSNGPPASATT